MPTLPAWQACFHHWWHWRQTHSWQSPHFRACCIVLLPTTTNQDEMQHKSQKSKENQQLDTHRQIHTFYWTNQYKFILQKKRSKDIYMEIPLTLDLKETVSEWNKSCSKESDFMNTRHCNSRSRDVRVTWTEHVTTQLEKTWEFCNWIFHLQNEKFLISRSLQLLQRTGFSTKVDGS